jgi:hypothetical protein
MAVPYTFATATTSIPLSELDINFATPITLGNTFVYLGNVITTVNNLTLTNTTISSGTIDLTAIGSTSASTGKFTTLTNTGTAYLGGASGNQSLQINNVASGVNYLQMQGAAIGNEPSFSVDGFDTDIGMALKTKGGAGFEFYSATGGALQFYIYPTASAVNYLQAAGGASGNFPTLRAQGSDTDIGLAYFTKGAGYHFFYNGAGSPQFAINPTPSAVNYLQVTGGATGTSVSFSAQGSDTNINIALTPKGTGVLSFGTYTAGTVAQAGYITIKDAGGTTRRLLVG